MDLIRRLINKMTALKVVTEPEQEPAMAGVDKTVQVDETGDIQHQYQTGGVNRYHLAQVMLTKIVNAGGRVFVKPNKRDYRIDCKAFNIKQTLDDRNRIMIVADQVGRLCPEEAAIVAYERAMVTDKGYFLDTVSNERHAIVDLLYENVEEGRYLTEHRDGLNFKLDAIQQMQGGHLLTIIKGGGTCQ